MEGAIKEHATGTVRRQGRRRPSLHKDVRFLACSCCVLFYRTRRLLAAARQAAGALCNYVGCFASPSLLVFCNITKSYFRGLR